VLIMRLRAVNYYRLSGYLHPYQSLFEEVDLETAAEDVHNGYFWIDKKGGWTETEEGNQSGRDNAERARRQTIGRGMRLCVNQAGERVRGFEVNTLTVVATEGYEQFAENLQKEIEADTGMRFGIVEHHQFAGVSVVGSDGKAAPLGFDQSMVLWQHLKDAGYVNASGKVQDTLKRALKDGTLTLPEWPTPVYVSYAGQFMRAARHLPKVPSIRISATGNSLDVGGRYVQCQRIEAEEREGDETGSIAEEGADVAAACGPLPADSDATSEGRGMRVKDSPGHLQIFLIYSRLSHQDRDRWITSAIMGLDDSAACLWCPTQSYDDAHAVVDRLLARDMGKAFVTHGLPTRNQETAA